jgi:hypothetical protein
MSIRDRPTAPRPPWQNGYCERAIGSIRRECLDHVVVFGERHLRHLLRSYATYYNSARTHLSVNKDAPSPRTVPLVAFCLCHFLADFIICMCVFDFRQVQDSNRPCQGRNEFDTKTLEAGHRVPEKIDSPQGGGSPLRLLLFKSLKENTMAHAARGKKAVDYEAKRTRDHDTIRRWAERRGGRPTMVEGTQILRIDFDDPDGSRDENLVPVSWDEFFRAFDERGLELLYQEHTHDGHISRFNKFVYEGTDREQD